MTDNIDDDFIKKIISALKNEGFVRWKTYRPATSDYDLGAERFHEEKLRDALEELKDEQLIEKLIEKLEEKGFINHSD